MIKLGEILPLALQLFDGDTAKYPRARLFKADGTELSGSPVALTHVANGLYKNSALTMPNENVVLVQYRVFNDSGFTIESGLHSAAVEEFFLEDNTFSDSQAGLEAEVEVEEDLETEFLDVSPEIYGIIEEQYG